MDSLAPQKIPVPAFSCIKIELISHELPFRVPSTLKQFSRASVLLNDFSDNHSKLNLFLKLIPYYYYKVVDHLLNKYSDY